MLTGVAISIRYDRGCFLLSLLKAFLAKQLLQDLPYMVFLGFVAGYPKSGPCSPPNLSAAKEIDKRTEVFSLASGWLGPTQVIASFKSVSV